MGRLLIENMRSAFTILEEAKKENGGRMKVSGIFGGMDEINGNGRVYPESIMDREIEKLKPLIEERCLYSEADHPEDGKSRIRFTAALPLKIEKKEIDGRKVYIGEALILNTDQGKNLQEIIRAGGKVGVSQRGFGDTKVGLWKGEQAEIVEDDYNLKTFDFVLGQSTKGGTVKEMTEQGLEVINLIEASACLQCERGCSVSTKNVSGKLTEVSKETKNRVKVLVEVMLAKHLKEKGRILTEVEVQQATDDIVKNNFDWRTWLVTSSLLAEYPSGTLLDLSGSKILFQNAGKTYSRTYAVKDYNVSFGDPVITDLTALTEQKREASVLTEDMKFQRRVAGLPDVYVLPIEEQKKVWPRRLTESELHDRRTAGLPEIAQDPEPPDTAKILMEQESRKKDRRVAGLE